MEHRIRSAVFNIIETLETRRLLASISGTVIEDLDNDGSRDGRERALAGVTVFLDQNRNRQLDFGESSVVTDASGFYEFTGLPAGQYFVGHLPPASYGQNSPPKGGFGNFGGDYDIRLEFAQSVPTAARSVIESAAARWEKIIVGDVAGQFDEDYGDIDDILLEVFGKKLDGFGGTLAQAAPSVFRDAASDDPNLPVRGFLEFDLADAKNPALFEIAIHEIGHALGFTLFTWFKYDDEETGFSLVRGTMATPLFVGANATREFNEIFDNDDSGVPLEPRGAGQGSEFSHFSEAIFGNELMTPALGESGSPLSRVTVGLLQDLGYRVDYRGADNYDPDIQDLPITAPATAGGGLLDFSYTITIDDADTSFQGRDFSDRLNRRPSIDAVRSDNALYAVNGIVKLRASGAFDEDAGDSVTAVAFYAETNGLEGLQTGAGGDTFVKSDLSPEGGFRVNANTESLGLPAGTRVFYARPYDELLTTGKTKMVEVQLFDATVAPRKPTSLSAVSIRSNQVRLEWFDRSDNEFGFIVERARDQFFTNEVKRFTVGSGTTSFLDDGVASGTTYFYRVRSFNIAGSSSFAGPLTVLTANLGDRVIDVTSELVAGRPEVSATGSISGIFDPESLNNNSLVLNGRSRVNISPMLDFDGEYFLYARWSPALSENAVGVFDIADSRGKQQRSVTVDQSVRGTEHGYVLIGKYQFNKLADAAITFRPSTRSQTVTLDAIRLLPAFDPTTR